MALNRKNIYMTLALLGIGFLAGCGGSGGGSAASCGGNDSTELTKGIVEQMAKDFAGEIGCTYNEPLLAPAGGNGALLETGRALLAVGAMLRPAERREYTLPAPGESVAGECGGRMSFTLNDNNTSALLQFDRYCTTKAGSGIRTYVDGTVAASVNKDMDVYSQIETRPSIEIRTTNPNTHKKVDVIVTLKNGTMKDEESFRADTLVVKDRLEGRTYKAEDLQIAMNEDTSTLRAGYSGPGVTNVCMQGSFTSDEEDVTVGRLTLRGKNGSEARFDLDDTFISITVKGEPVGGVDCSMIILPEKHI